MLWWYGANREAFRGQWVPGGVRGGPPGFSRGRVVRRGPRGSLDSRLGGVGGGPLQHVDLLLSGSSAAAPMEHPSGSARTPSGTPHFSE